ncbi:MAG: Omp28-related outer membrane protein [Bacteroidetes bacterium]|nr:Omp28-related outer membrane protein [Bacteroidota bacterium]
MKKPLLLLIGTFLSTFSFSQIFTDDFESYAAGSYVGPQSTSWTTWSGAEGGAEDAQVTTNQASSGTKSIYLSSTSANGGPQDVVLDFGPLYNSGVFTFQSDFYVNSGKTGYFNFQASQTIGQTWALNVNFDAGDMYIDDGVTSNLVVSTYPQAAWFTLKIEANLTLKVWKAYIDGNLVGTWINGVNALASLDLYPIQNSQFYVDDVSFDHQPYTLSNLNGMMAMAYLGGELAGQNVTPKLTVVNAGTTAITSFDVNLNYGGNNYSQSVTGVNIASTSNYAVTLNSLPLVAGNQVYTATVSNVNGTTDDISSDNTLVGSINPVVPAVGKMVVSEEGTGTWCQWCPRGAVFMDQFNTKYSQFWAGIAVHNGDPMTVTNYDAAFGGLISGYPSALVDRGNDVDPSGMTPDFLTRVQIAPKAFITNGATWDAATRTLNVSVTADFQASANSNYKLACVLTEDGVTGTGSGYNQSNAYSGGNNGVMGGYETLGNPVPAAQMVYDHVARAIAPSFSGYTNSFPVTVVSGDQHTLNFSFVLPTTWDENEIHIVGLLIDPSGKIDNAGKATITEAVSNGYVSGSNAGLYEANVTQLDESVNIYPNPSNSQANIALNLKSTTEVEVSILDLSGKLMSQRNYGLLDGNITIPLNVNSYSSGVYIVKTAINGTIVQKRLMIE